MYPKSYCQGDAYGLGERCIQCAYGFHNTQSSTDGAMRIVLMRLGITEIHKQSVTKQLGDMPIVALDNVGTNPLIGTDHLPVLFGIELAGESSRIHQVTEEHGELAALRVR